MRTVYWPGVLVIALVSAFVPVAGAAQVAADPTVGEPSYEATVAWLESHTQLHGVQKGHYEGIPIYAKMTAQASKWPCVLFETGALHGSKQGNEKTIREVLLLSLSRMLIAGTTLKDSEFDPSGSCVAMKGLSDFALVVKPEEGSGKAPVISERRTYDNLCYDTRENAARASRALKHLAKLCGASQEKEPF